MINVLLDELPEGCVCSSGNFYRLNFDFRAGIQIQLVQDNPELTDTEKQWKTMDLLFLEEVPRTTEEYQECLTFYFSGWNHDNPGKKENKRLMDFDVDQWRIFSAFWQQYRMNLNEADLELHFWQFMGMLSSLEDCSYTRVIDIRQRDIPTGKNVDKNAKKALIEAKEVYALRQITTREEAEFEDYLSDFLCDTITPQEKKRIEKFEQFGKGE